MKLDRVLETCLYTPDLDAAEAFYRDVLGLELHSRMQGRHSFFRCGRNMLLLFNSTSTEKIQTVIAGQPMPLHGSHGSGHVAFAVPAEELPAWRAKLKLAGVAIECELKWPSGGKSVYFRDPAGNVLELATPFIWDA